MELSFVKLFAKRSAQGSRAGSKTAAPRLRDALQLRAFGPRRLLGAAVLAAWALTTSSAYAQDQAPDTDDTSVTMPDAFGPASPDRFIPRGNTQRLVPTSVFQSIERPVMTWSLLPR